MKGMKETKETMKTKAMNKTNNKKIIILIIYNKEIGDEIGFE